MTKTELESWKRLPCVLEIDLEYPVKFRDLHNDYPVAAEQVEVNKVNKLIPNLNGQKKYVVHYENLKMYERLGFEISKIHGGVLFEESDWLKQYIDLNTTLTAKASNDFEKDFFQADEQ